MEKEISELRVALDSKEKDLQAHPEELARLQRAGEEFLQVEAVECERLRVLASSLEGEWAKSSFSWCLFLLLVY